MSSGWLGFFSRQHQYGSSALRPTHQERGEMQELSVSRFPHWATEPHSQHSHPLCCLVPPHEDYQHHTGLFSNFSIFPSILARSGHLVLLALGFTERGVVACCSAIFLTPFPVSSFKLSPLWEGKRTDLEKNIPSSFHLKHNKPQVRASFSWAPPWFSPGSVLWWGRQTRCFFQDRHHH